MSVLSRLLTKAPSPSDQDQKPAEASVLTDAGNSAATHGSTELEDLLSSSVPIDPAKLQSAIDSITDPADLRKLAIDGGTTTVRQLAAHAINDPDQLRDLLKDVRGKDKNVYKIIREKCDALLAIDKAAAEIQANIASLCSALERHVHVPFDNLYAPALEHFVSQWNTVATQADSETQARANAAIDRCRQNLSERTRAKDEEAARIAAVGSADADRQTVLTEMRQLLTELPSQSRESVDTAPRLAAWASTWSELARYKSASANDQTAFSQLTKTIASLAELIAQHGTAAQLIEALGIVGPDQEALVPATALRRMLDATSILGDATPDIVNDAKVALQTYDDARKEKQDSAATALRQLGGLIRKASGVLNSGNTRLAAGLRRAIEEKMQSVPNVPPHLASQLQQLDDKLSVLQDWRSYAVAPKRIELIEHMEALIDLDENPKALAEQIKRLQDEWKAISKGTTDDSGAEWERFHQAAQKAYEPCRVLFAAQAKQREANLAKRKALLERLTNFVNAQDWQTTDWREVARALRESKQQWQNHQFVERSANKPLQIQFDKLTQDLESKLETESANNVQAKKTLIARAQALLANEDSRQAIDAIKQLQSKWTSIGIVARDEDQKLWAEFRQHCDAVFAKRTQQRNQLVSSLEEAKRKAIALCEEAEQVASLSGAELLEGAKKLSALSELFEAVGELPKADARNIQTRFDRALSKCEKAVAAQRVRDKAQAWNTVLDAGDKIRAYRWAVSQNNDPESAKQAALAFIEGVTTWPKGALQIVKAELAKTGAANVAENENALRTLCIRAEILTETPTPESDQAFRRNYQLQRLMKGFGQSSTSSQDEFNAMVFEWIAVGATSDAVYAELLARFARCRAKT